MPEPGAMSRCCCRAPRSHNATRSASRAEGQQRTVSSKCTSSTIPMMEPGSGGSCAADLSSWGLPATTNLCVCVCASVSRVT
eukprot:5709966-Lingulodinium_polyedra.AAC.1